MSEKVLGFYEDSVEYIKGKPIWRNAFMVYENDTVSVRLASESVDLKALKEYCKTHETLRDCIARDSLIEWAEKEAKKNV